MTIGTVTVDLADLLLAHSPGSSERRSSRALADAIRAALLAAQAAWPTVHVEAAQFVRYIADRLPDTADAGLALAALHVADLYLACACARADARALQEFERAFLSAVPRYVRRIDGTPAFVDELVQVLRRRLLVSEAASPPRITEYTGRGPLGGWLRVTAIRTAQNLKRSEKAHVQLDGDLDREVPSIRPPVPDPELAYLKSRYAEEFAHAFRGALAALTPKERNVLTLYFLDGVGTAAIGAMYGVHAATVRRWIEQARNGIVSSTRTGLAERLNARPEEIDSLIGLVQSQLEMTIRRFLQ